MSNVDKSVSIDYADVYAFTQLPFGGVKVDIVVMLNKTGLENYLVQCPEVTTDDIESARAFWHSYPYRISGLVRNPDDDLLGRLVFVKDDMDIKILMHEVQHVVNSWRASFVDGIDPMVYDEHLAHLVGSFVGVDLYNWLYQTGLEAALWR